MSTHMRAISLTITLAPLYYFHTKKSGCHVMRERRERVQEFRGISGAENFSKWIIAFKVNGKHHIFLTPI